MSADEDYNSEEDLDYVPSDGEQVSEEENSGEEEDLSILHDGDGEIKAGTTKRGRPGRKKKSVIESRKRKGGIKLNDAKEDQKDDSSSINKQEADGDEQKRKEELAEQIAQEKEMKKGEKEKKRVDDLWSCFMADVKKPPPKSCGSAPAGSGLGTFSSQVQPSNKESSSSNANARNGEKSGKVIITKVFDFAGEEIKVTEEVDANSKEAKAEQKKQEKAEQDKSVAPLCLGGAPTLQSGLKRPSPSGGGLGSVLSKISKKNKMGTLEKSKLDWTTFKQKEGIEEDLKIHNKGKHGYTERIAFLNRADQRQFEVERDMRLGTNSKR